MGEIMKRFPMQRLIRFRSLHPYWVSCFMDKDSVSSDLERPIFGRACEQVGILTCVWRYKHFDNESLIRFYSLPSHFKVTLFKRDSDLSDAERQIFEIDQAGNTIQGQKHSHTR